jgi:hypothetical protein
MKFRKATFIITLIAVLSIFSLFYSCGGGGGGSSSSNEPSEQYTDVSGTWDVNIVRDDTECNNGSTLIANFTYQYTITQDKSSLTIIDQDGYQFKGTLVGDTMNWTGSRPYKNGTSTITASSLTVSGNSLTGTVNWSFTNGSKTCSLTSQYSGTREVTTYKGPAGTWSIIDNAAADSCGDPAETNTYTSTFTINGNQITVTDPEGEPVSGTLSGHTATLKLTTNDSGDTSTTNISLTFSTDWKTVTGNVSWSENYSGGSCSGTDTLTGTHQ